MQIVYNSHLSVEFRSEIKILGQIEHLNLVRFFGYLEENDERLVVVEYVPNGTLRQHLDGNYIFLPFFLLYYQLLMVNMFV